MVYQNKSGISQLGGQGIRPYNFGILSFLTRCTPSTGWCVFVMGTVTTLVKFLDSVWHICYNIYIVSANTP